MWQPIETGIEVSRYLLARKLDVGFVTNLGKLDYRALQYLGSICLGISILEGKSNS
jgi:hypothetical protein